MEQLILQQAEADRLAEEARAARSA
jgi:hypothetical protein